MIPVASLAVVALLGSEGRTPAGADPVAKHVILMVADGAGYNTWLATAMYEGSTGRDFHDGPGWIHRAVSTYALARRRVADDADPLPDEELQDPRLVYEPSLAWDLEPTSGGKDEFPCFFRGYRWLRRAPDSANTATAMATGRKTYVGAINADAYGKRIRPTIASWCHDLGRRVGVITSVPFSHATPAALGGAFSPSRSTYRRLALEMLTSGALDVIAGGGNPDFDRDGRPRRDPGTEAAKYVGGERIWGFLTDRLPLAPGDTVAADAPEEATIVNEGMIRALDSWVLAQSAAEIEAYRDGPTPPKLLLVPQVARTLQQERSSTSDSKKTAPGEDPWLPNVPTLETLTRVALNALDDDEDGFFLHVEGGAVDWAMHDHETGRMIEEMSDFKRSVQAVIDWVEEKSDWDETLLVVTADHDHMLWGPESDRVPFDPLRDRGAGRVPEHRWLYDGHSGALVPLYARGVGSEMLAAHATRTDPVRGPYLDQTDIFRVMSAVTTAGGPEAP